MSDSVPFTLEERLTTKIEKLEEENQRLQQFNVNFVNAITALKVMLKKVKAKLTDKQRSARVFEFDEQETEIWESL